MSEDPGALLRAALEEQARGMTEEEFRQFTARTRPPDFSSHKDPADRSRAIMSSIAAKQAESRRRLGPVDENGYHREKGTGVADHGPQF